MRPRPFREGSPYRCCKTCVAIADRDPPTRAVDPASDLARIRYVLANARLSALVDAEPDASRQLVTTLYRLTG